MKDAAKALLASMVLLVGVLTASIPFRTQAKDVKSASNQSLSVKQLLSATNSYRSSNNIKALEIDHTLNQTAQLKCNELVAKNYWSHVSPDGAKFEDMYKAEGVHYTKGAENLYRGNNSAGGIVQAWSGSPSHNAALLNKNYGKVGFGVCQNQDRQSVVVQHFTN